MGGIFRAVSSDYCFPILSFTASCSWSTHAALAPHFDDPSGAAFLALAPGPTGDDSASEAPLGGGYTTLAAHAALRAVLGLPSLLPPASPLCTHSVTEEAWVAHAVMAPLLREVGFVQQAKAQQHRERGGEVRKSGDDDLDATKHFLHCSPQQEEPRNAGSAWAVPACVDPVSLLIAARELDAVAATLC